MSEVMKKSFKFYNQGSNITPTSLSKFSLKTRYRTDLWRKPPNTNDNDAPAYVTLAFPTKEFHRALVTVEANWEKLYDQGGLVLFFPDGTDTSAWIKTGIEIYDDCTNVSTVTTGVGKDRTSDWSLVPIKGNKVTIEVERKGVALWVYIVGEDGSKKGIREVTWPFAGEGMVEVGVYTARPSEGKGDLEVTFTDLVIE